MACRKQHRSPLVVLTAARCDDPADVVGVSPWLFVAACVVHCFGYSRRACLCGCSSSRLLVRRRTHAELGGRFHGVVVMRLA